MRKLLRQQFQLVLLCLVVAALLWLPIVDRFKNPGAICLILALVLCLAPGCMVLAIPVAWNKSPSIGLLVLAGSVCRLAMVLGGLLVVVIQRPDLPLPLFGGLLVVFYLLSLGYETLMAVVSIRSSERRCD